MAQKGNEMTFKANYHYIEAEGKYFFGWWDLETMEKPCFSSDEECVVMYSLPYHTSEAQEDYARLQELGYDAEICSAYVGR